MDKHVFTDKQKKLIAWAAIAIFLLLSAAVGWFIGRPLVRFASRPEEFRLWVDGHGLLGMAAYVGMVFLQVVVAVIPGEPLEISGGYAFGALRGSVLCLLGGFWAAWRCSPWCGGSAGSWWRSFSPGRSWRS